jgi:hypothetical protein
MERKLMRFPSSSQATGHRLDGRALLLQKAAKAVTADLASGAAWTTVRTARGGQAPLAFPIVNWICVAFFDGRQPRTSANAKFTGWPQILGQLQTSSRDFF